MRARLSPLVILLVTTNIFTVSSQEKSSLTYVIDNTGSMKDDIRQVKQSTDGITKIVLDEKSSQIHNMVLVTFNDPHARLEIVTSNRNDYKRKISSIIAHNPYGNRDCAEPSMNGILLGLQNSLPGSFIYVFTDASSKDYFRSHEVTNLCQQKQSQITFVLTGHCRQRGFKDAGFQVYYDIATACAGLAFYVPKHEVNQVLKPIKDWLTGNKTLLTRRNTPPNTYTNIPFTIDDQTEYAIVTASGIGVSLEITGPRAIQDHLMWVKNAKVIKLIDPSPGTYTARVKSTTETAVYVVGRTDFLFSHGFSPIEPKSISDTTPQPIANAETHVSIAVTDPKHTVNILSVQILDIDEKVLTTLPLKRVGNDFYTTPPFIAPSKRFKVAVNGKAVRNNKYIRRIAKIPVTPQEPPKPKSQKPVVTISEGKNTEVDYGKTIKLTCKISAYPTPKITWKNSQGVTLPSQTVTVKLPYDHISYLTISDATKNDTYTCHADNDQGSVSNTIHLNVKEPFDVKSTPKDKTEFEYGKPGTLTCDIRASVPMHIYWSYVDAKGTSKPLAASDKYEISADGKQLTLKKLDLDMVGKYVCKAVLDKDPNKTVTSSTEVKIGGLLPPKLVDKINETENTETASKGSDVVIKCPVTGVPKPSITWKFMAEGSSEFVSVPGSDDVLRISNVDVKHAGRYKCTARNVLGEVERDTTLNVHVPPKLVDKIDKPETASKGSDVVIKCPVTGVPKPSISWKFMAEGSSEFVSVPGSDDVLRISNVDVKHAGRYKCIARNVLGEVERDTTLTIHVPPKISITDTVYKVIEDKDSQLKIPCVATGLPKPVITWKVNGVAISQSAKYSIEDGTLIIKNPKVSDSQTYQCVATNEAGSVDTTVKINVQQAPQVSGVTTKKAKIGSNVNLECSLIKGVPKPTISWQFMAEDSSKYMSLPETGDVLVIPSVQVKHAGRYKCVAQNVVDKAEHVTTLNVQVPPKITPSSSNIYKGIEGRDTQLKIPCKTVGVPKPAVTWIVNGKKVSQNAKYSIEDGDLIIKNPTVSDSQTYMCEATSEAGSVYATFKATVLQAPLIIGLSEMTVQSGATVQIECNVVKGVPTPAIAWQFMSKYDTKFVPIPLTGRVLSLSGVNKKYAGRYKCIARNDVDAAEHVTTLTVEYAPIITSMTNNTYEALEGDVALRIPCDTEGEPKPTIKWKISGVTIIPNARVKIIDGALVIKDPKETDTNSYTCDVKNSMGTARATFTTEVHTVLGEPDETEEVNILKGTTKKLECGSDDPTQKVRWFKEGEELNTKHKYIYITNADYYHAGNYSCRVSDMNGGYTVEYSVVVGTPPVFTFEQEDSVFDWNGSDTENDVLDCGVENRVPEINVTWTYNGKVLKGQHSQQLAVDGKWGHYICNVSNVHGANQKSFDVISTLCFIKRNPKDGHTRPLILNQDASWPALDSTEDFLAISPGETIKFSCPSRQGVRNAFKEFPSSNEIKATCINQDIFEVNRKPYQVSDLDCLGEIDAIVNREHLRCLAEHSELMRVGYNIHGFLETYEVCFDTASNIPLYAHVVMSKSNRGRGVTNAWYKYPGIASGKRDLEYTCVNASSSCCYAKAQLVNARDVSDGPPQKSTYIDPLNAIPYWRPCDGKDSWGNIENMIRSQLGTYPQFEVWSGTHSNFKIQTRNGRTVPRYLWKVLKFDSEDSIAVVYVNHPSPTTGDILCNNICVDDNVTWLHDLDHHHTYCCKVDDFLRAFDLRDTPIGESMNTAHSKTRPRKN